MAETVNDQRAQGLVTALLNADTTQVPDIIEQLEPYRQWSDGRLREQLKQHDEESTQRLHCSLALLPSDPAQVDYLLHRLLTSQPVEVAVIRTALEQRKDRVIDALWTALEVPDAGDDKQLQAASALAVYAAHEGRWSGVAKPIADALVNENPLRLAVWIELLAPASEHLLEPLAAIFRNREGTYSQAQQDLATNILERYAADVSPVLGQLVLDARPKQFAILFDEFSQHGEEAAAICHQELDRELSSSWPDPPLSPAWTRPDDSMAEELENAYGTLMDWFAFCQTMPFQRFIHVSEELRKSGYRPIQFRPYTTEAQRALEPNAPGQEDPSVAAIWTRDASDWRLAYDLTVDELSQHNERLRSEGLTAIDVASYVAPAAGLPSERFCGIWAKVARGQDHLLSNREFQQLVQEARRARPFAKDWNYNPGYESRAATGQSADEHLDHCRGLIAEDFWPVAIWAGRKDRHSIHTASVWHRPHIPETTKDSLAQRQANAAVCLVRMGQTDRLWPLLKQSPDSRLRTWLIHRLSSLAAGPAIIAARLPEESEVSIRRALILSLGEYESIPRSEQTVLERTLLNLYADDPDPGIHGAAEWVLRRWNRRQVVDQVREEFATGKTTDQRRWYVARTGQTLSIVPGPVEFQMGSPKSEYYSKPNPTLHLRRVNRSFAIGTTEVTVEQFRRFLENQPEKRTSYAAQYEDPGKPVIRVTWYDAVQYCNWMSEKDGIPREQWCYLPSDEHGFAEGMRPAEDYLNRMGYRLPTEAEWEFACRAGSATSRHFGNSVDLMGEYCWYVDSSHIQTWAVGLLKPNDLGLFDMHGNVWEWCQDRDHLYPDNSNLELVFDTEDASVVRDREQRILRGGAYGKQPDLIRSGLRQADHPSSTDDTVGFRVARTYPD